MVNINKLMKQAQEMQERIAREMEELQVEATSGGGAVTVVMNGKKEVQSVSIKKEAVDPADVEMLEDLVKAAFNEAARMVDEELSSQMGGMMPPGFTAPV
jgi:DNA-binding YbaB/EbfC family protein